MNFHMNFHRLLSQDKKLLVKVIAGVVLLAAAFSFYLAKEMAADSDMTVSEIPGSRTGMSVEAAEPDAENGGQATAAAVREERRIMIDVGGAVLNPSVVELPEGSRVFQAVEKAGGLQSDADTTLINQAEILADGQKIYIPTKQELKEYQSGYRSSAQSYYAGPAQLQLININTADSDTLQQLSGVGPATAEKIILYRNENGKFMSIEDIKNVSGIGEKTFEKFKDKITV